MTDTVNAAAKHKGAKLTINRLYTTPGVHPYDGVTWEPRDKFLALMEFEARRARD